MLKASAETARGPSQTTSPRPPPTQPASASQVASGSGGGSTSTMPRQSSQGVAASAAASMSRASNRAWPDFASTAGAIACVRKSPVLAAGAGAATSTRAGAPTSTVKAQESSAARSSVPSISSRPCRVPGSRPGRSRSIWTASASRKVTGLMPRRA